MTQRLNLSKCSYVDVCTVHFLYCITGRLEVCVDELKDWLRQMEERLKKEAVLLGASQPGVPDCSTRLKRVKEIHKELLARRFVLIYMILGDFFESELLFSSGLVLLYPSHVISLLPDCYNLFCVSF